MDPATHRLDIHDVVERLTREFAGLLAPGLIRRIVYQTDHLVLHCAAGAHDPVALCERIARSLLDARAVMELRAEEGADAASA